MNNALFKLSDAKSTCARVLQSVSMRLSKITVDPAKDRRRNDTELQDLLESLSEVGLLHPILVLPADDEGNHQLLAGHRRLRAARRLGWEEVPARIVTLDGLRAELAALAENLVRRPLPAGEQLRAIARAKSIYEQLHPETRPGGCRLRSNGHHGRLKTDSFADYTAKTSGQSARTIRRKAMVGDRASAKILEALDQGSLSLAVAEQVVALPIEDQDRALERWRSRGPSVVGGHAGASSSPSFRPYEHALARAVKRLVFSTQTVVRELAPAAASMDVCTVRLCREHLSSIQISIAQVLPVLEQELRKKPGDDTIVRTCRR